MDEGKLNEMAARGSRAQTLLENDLLKDAFKYLSDEYVATWKLTTPKDAQAREQLWIAVNIIGKVQDHLTKFVVDGKIASRDLANIKYLKP